MAYSDPKKEIMMKFTEAQERDFDIRKWYDLSGQVAVVTGGASGLGLAITRCLASAGAKVCVASRGKTENAEEALRPLGDAAAFYSFDVMETEKAEALIGQVVRDQGGSIFW